MDINAAHTGFVIAAYLVSAIILCCLVLAVVMRGKRLDSKPKSGSETQ